MHMSMKVLGDIKNELELCRTHLLRFCIIMQTCIVDNLYPTQIRPVVCINKAHGPTLHMHMHFGHCRWVQLQRQKKTALFVTLIHVQVMSLNLKYLPSLIDSLCLQVAEVPKSQDVAIFFWTITTTTTEPIISPLRMRMGYLGRVRKYCSLGLLRLRVTVRPRTGIPVVSNGAYQE